MGCGGQVVARLPRNRLAAALTALHYIGGRCRRRHGDVFFPAQLPRGVHRALFFIRDCGRVVVQLPHNYPAVAHSALFLIRMAVIGVTAMYVLQLNYPVVSTAPYFLLGMMAR